MKRFFEVGDVKDFEKFAQDNQSWLELFAEYMAIKEHFEILLGLNGQMLMLVLVKLQHLKATVSNWQTKLVVLSEFLKILNISYFQETFLPLFLKRGRRALVDFRIINFRRITTKVNPFKVTCLQQALFHQDI